MENNLQLFNHECAMLFMELRDLEFAKKELKTREDEARAALENAMSKYNIKEVDNQYVKVTFIDAVPKSKKLDEKTWRAEDPEGYNEVFNKYNKLAGGRKASVRITPK